MSPVRREIPTIADAVAIDALLVNRMKQTLVALLQLNVRGFRTTYKGSYYTPFEVLKQALELLFEFGVSTKSYREALRTIHVYSQGDREAEQELGKAFSTFANASYTVYAGMKYVEEISPEVIFLEGVRPDESDFQRVFRSVGVKPPILFPASSRKAVFLDEGFEPYKLALSGVNSLDKRRGERMRYWAERITATVAESADDSLVLLRIGVRHVGDRRPILDRLGFGFQDRALRKLLSDGGYDMRVIFRGVLLEDVFERK